MRGAIIVCVLAALGLATAGHPLPGETGNARAGDVAGLAAQRAALAVTEVWLSSPPADTDISPSRSKAPCYCVGVVAPYGFNDGMMPRGGPAPSPQAPGSIKYCHPAPPMAFGK